MFAHNSVFFLGTILPREQKRNHVQMVLFKWYMTISNHDCSWYTHEIMYRWSCSNGTCLEAHLRHINCRHLTLESADKLTNMSSRIQDTTYFAVFMKPIQGSNPAICYCYFNTEGRPHRNSLMYTQEIMYRWSYSDGT